MTLPPPSFGIELEFFLLDRDGVPCLGATERVIRRWKARGWDRPPVPELASFQIELNPGPWPLTRAGLARATAETQALVDQLDRCAEEEGLSLSRAALVPRIEERHLSAPDYFAQIPAFLASANHFSHRRVAVPFADGTNLTFPGETVVGALNEIHIHVRLEDDAATLALFNHLNRRRNAAWEGFMAPLSINGKRLADGYDTTTLFTEANGEWNLSGDLRRIGWINREIHSAEEYRQLAQSFAPVVIDPNTGTTLPDERAVWFWVRLHGTPGSLRVEYRPTEMGEDWPARVDRLFHEAHSFHLSRARREAQDASPPWRQNDAMVA